MKIIIGFVTLKTVLFTLLHKTFRLPPINDHDVNKRAAEIIVIYQKLTKGVAKCVISRLLLVPLFLAGPAFEILRCCCYLKHLQAM
jgi:hypothetical protein